MGHVSKSIWTTFYNRQVVSPVATEKSVQIHQILFFWLVKSDVLSFIGQVTILTD